MDNPVQLELVLNPEERYRDLETRFIEALKIGKLRVPWAGIVFERGDCLECQGGGTKVMMQEPSRILREAGIDLFAIAEYLDARRPHAKPVASVFEGTLAINACGPSADDILEAVRAQLGIAAA